MSSTLAKTQAREPVDLAALEAALRPLSSASLKTRFLECYGGAAALLGEAAVCVKLLKERGDSMAGIPMVGTFLKIASGQILADLVFEFADSPNHRLVEQLPLDDQKRLSRNSMVPVVEPKRDGGFTTRMIDLKTAPQEVARLVAGPAGIRTPEEQAAQIFAHKTRDAVKQAASREVGEPLTRQVTVRLTESEYEAVRLHAALARVSEAEAVRRFLLGTKAFKRPKT